MSLCLSICARCASHDSMGCGASKNEEAETASSTREAKPEVAKSGDATEPAEKWPPMTVTIEKKKFTVNKTEDGEADKLGDGVWADVFKGKGPKGEDVALKMLRDLPEAKKKKDKPPPRNTEEQIAENVAECKLHKRIQKVAKDALKEGKKCAMVPEMIASANRQAAIAFVDGESFESHLRKKREIGDLDGFKELCKVIRIVLRKVRANPLPPHTHALPSLPLARPKPTSASRHAHPLNLPIPRYSCWWTTGNRSTFLTVT